MKKQVVKIQPPLYSSTVSAGFPSPAEDLIDRKLDLNEFVVQHPNSTFFVKVAGDSMIGAGILDGDILVVDRSLNAKNQDIILAIIEGEFTVKRLAKSSTGVALVPENSNYKPIKIDENSDFEVWGVVTSIIRKLSG
ncbi:translesion error-prone DNA polymerase V autoproteolytic subunit [Candidatus Dojkabacteria bacterium]|nr:translesion error-prone DNA polymerase V autoproteolytic subunit [Candidatus Dojkabacteria bacterium]